LKHPSYYLDYYYHHHYYYYYYYYYHYNYRQESSTTMAVPYLYKGRGDPHTRRYGGERDPSTTGW